MHRMDKKSHMPNGDFPPVDAPSDSLGKLLSIFGDRIQTVTIETAIGEKRQSVSVTLGPQVLAPGSAGSHAPIVSKMAYEGFELSDAWFEAANGASRLIVATAYCVEEKEFWVNLSAGVFLKFTHLADVKNQRLFEASQVSLGHAQGQCEQDSSLLLLGPLQRVSPEPR